MNLITLLVSEDEGSNRHVSNVLSDPVHLGHHPVYFVKILTLRNDECVCQRCKRVFLRGFYSYITCYNHNCAGTGNIHAMRFRNKMESIPCVFIIQSHSYLFVNFLAPTGTQGVKMCVRLCVRPSV